MEVPSGFLETRAHGFLIITRPAYHDTAVELARRDPETLLAEAPAPAGAMQGRGAHLELPGQGGETILLKKCRRGGLYGRLMGDVYRDDFHAVSEVFLSETAWRKGVPVALLAFALSAPAAPGRPSGRRRGYVAAIKVDRARSLMDCLLSQPAESERRAILAAVAQTVSRSHDRGFRHGDLNLGNILIVKSELGDHGGWLIDLAGSELGGTLRIKPRVENLVRLYRSAQKWLPDPDPRRRNREIVRFLRVYTGRAKGEVRQYLQAAARHRASLLVHRLGWKATGAGAGGGGKGPGGPVNRRSSAPAAR